MVGFYLRPTGKTVFLTKECLTSYGIAGVRRVVATVDGRCFGDFRDKYNVAVVAFHTNGVKDANDEVLTAKTGLHDIQDVDLGFAFELDPKYIEEHDVTGINGTNFVLLLVRKTVRMDQFSTLRQAEAMGVLSVEKRFGTF